MAKAIRGMGIVGHDEAELLVQCQDHLTEKIEVHLPLTLPCKDIYEKVNTTLEVLALKDRLEGSPDFLEDHQDDDDDDEDDDDGGGGDDKPKKGKVANRVEHQEEEFNRMMEEMDIKLDKEKSDEVEVVGEPPIPPPDSEPPYDVMTDLNITLRANLVTASSTSATLASMSSLTNVEDLIELAQMVAKKYEDHQGRRVATVLKSGGHYLPRREMSSFVVENSKLKLRNSRRSS